eukprot:COSAG06_NODE_41585_length_389_cov_12.661885_1_plen_66_part_10
MTGPMATRLSEVYTYSGLYLDIDYVAHLRFIYSFRLAAAGPRCGCTGEEEHPYAERPWWRRNGAQY